MAASSLVTPNLISLDPKSLPNLSHPILSSNLSFSACISPSSFLPLLSISGKGRAFGFSVLRKVAVSSDIEEEEEEYLSEEDDDVSRSFSPDLKLFVGNLPFSVDSSELAGLFQSAGNVEQVEVIYDKVTGRSRGFGFVTMSTFDEVEAAAQQFNGYEIRGRAMRVNSGPAPPRGEEFPSRGFQSRGGGRGGGGGGSFGAGHKVYVGNLSWGVDDSALETLFRRQGKVTDAKVIYDRESGRSRGFGFVTYSTAEEANNAISSLDGSDLDGRAIRVTVAEGRPPRRQF